MQLAIINTDKPWSNNFLEMIWLWYKVSKCNKNSYEEGIMHIQFAIINADKDYSNNSLEMTSFSLEKGQNIAKTFKRTLCICSYQLSIPKNNWQITYSYITLFKRAKI
jgi:hypothetical protein